MPKLEAGAQRYTAGMLWVKSFHIIFVASWFAGLFYLPRIFVNLAMVPEGSVAERERLLLMARKLLRFTTLLAVPALVLLVRQILVVVVVVQGQMPQVVQAEVV